MTKFKLGERVRIKTTGKVFRVRRITPTGKGRGVIYKLYKMGLGYWATDLDKWVKKGANS
jgi:hypothetical protein